MMIELHQGLLQKTVFTKAAEKHRYGGKVTDRNGTDKMCSMTVK